MEKERKSWCSFAKTKKLSTSAISVYETKMNTHQTNRAIIIVDEKVTTMAHQAIERIGDKYTMEVFLVPELLINITKHRYVPKHTILTSKEKQALLKKYQLKETQLPRMNKRDAISRFYGLKHGQVVKISRKSETAGRYITYRIVLD
mmetsp:Transcript_29145/g.71105  ORF Transcript_29145/g.71105 Transcript_29145/m.71105 type:complete len:147 (-) Transcript_29145:344-784(-)